MVEEKASFNEMDKSRSVKLLVEKFERMSMRKVHISGAPQDWHLKGITGRVAQTIAKFEHNIFPYRIGNGAIGRDQATDRWVAVLKEKMLRHVRQQIETDYSDNLDDEEVLQIGNYVESMEVLSEQEHKIKPTEASSDDELSLSSKNMKSAPSFNGFSLINKDVQFVRSSNSCTW
ncbi:uncharacterized protein LOC117793503 [Drosophila innubila]|uniref:uncharacterized protein LOC117793503 n=1 Tax=Drosophila innubila TaxID=198719 RepID=UPI00148D74B9|nr:uncharacterized protein LOC117793503 [Drosophila innubila]